MKTKLMMIGALAATCVVHELAAMPTAEETRQAVPVVKKLLATESEALKAGRKTRSEVAVAAMKLADETDTVAAKLLLMKGAFVLYVRDGNLEKAAETMNAIKAEIPDVPPQSVTNMIEAAHLGASKKEDCARLYKLIGEAKTESTTEKTRKDIAKLFPGWSLDSEVPQENREEWASGFCAHHRGQDGVLRLHPLNRETPIVLSRTLTLSKERPCLFLKTASFDKNTDFFLSVLVDGKEVLPKRLIRTPDSAPWQDISVPLYAWCGSKVKIEVVLAANDWYLEHPYFKRLEVAEGTGQEKFVSEVKETVNGYTWSYRVDNGGAAIVAEKDGRFSCAVSPAPTGDLKIPATLNGVKVTRIGRAAFQHCKELTSVAIPEGVTHIEWHAFDDCGGLKSVTFPSSLKDIGFAAFGGCMKLTSATIPNGVKSISNDAFNGCGLKSVVLPESVKRIGDRAFCACRELESVAIPAGVASIGKGVFGWCNALKLIKLDSGNQAFTLIDGALYTKDRSELVMWPNPPKSVVIPKGVTKIRAWAFTGGRGMTSVTIPESVTSIDGIVFIGCEGLKSITIPSRVKSMGEHVFERCMELTEVTMLGERPDAPETLFPGCGKLKTIHVPANAKSWAGMKDWFGIPLVFDAK